MFLSQPDTCPVDIKGKRRQAYSGGRDTYVRLFVSNNAGVDFDEVCIPQQLRVGGGLRARARAGRFMIALVARCR